MKLSIIVPVYNMAGDGKLKFCLDSLIKQTISDYEIIAVDDASTDSSPEILREYEKQYSGKVKVISYAKNKRQGGAKNEGMKAAVGEWIGFVDSDDWVTPDCYEKLLEKADATGADVVGCDYSLVSEHTFEAGRVVRNNSSDQTGILDEERHRKLILRPGSMVVKIYKTSVILENHLDFPEGIFYEDNCAAPLWSMYFRHFERVEQPLYFYYQHTTSTVHGITVEKCRDRMRAMERFLEECRERKFQERYRREIEFRFTELYYCVTLFSYMQGVRHPNPAFIRELRDNTVKCFPKYTENEYYIREVGQEERRLIAMQMKSNLKFYLYYRLRTAARRAKNCYKKFFGSAKCAD